MNKRYQTVRIFVILFWVCSLFLLLPKDVFADGSSFEISPSVLKIQAKPPADVWAPFTVVNRSDQPTTFTIGYKPFDPQASQNGNVVFLKNGSPIQGQDKKIFQHIQVVDAKNNSFSTIVIGPKQSTTLRLHLVLSANEPSSDYYFSLIFLQSPSAINQNISKDIDNRKNTVSTLQTGIGMNILLAVGEKEAPIANIDSFTTSFFKDSGPVPFELTVFNDGPHFISPSGQILIKNMFGQTVGKIDIPSTVILDGTGRTLTSKAIITSAGSSSKPLLIWPEKFILGLYTATLTLAVSDQGPIYTRTINFFAFPIHYLFYILGLVLIAILFYLRVKRKIS
ncbi:MAG TPA: hypothetical protein VLF93_00360 [Candidatus Saccharimonadales bacterium]|nr:hypothetical protein [Candidatus Saccharimonadales bacterium]